MAFRTAPARQNLPVESDSLVGRDRDLSDLLRQLESARVLTLAGADGVGKSRLALRLAAHATSFFADGVWLALLGDTTTRTEVVARVCHALGVTEEARRDPMETLCDALRGRALLLVLDGCDSVAGPVAEIGAALVAHCPAVSLLITGREPLRFDGETVWRVLPLPVGSTAEGAEPSRDGAERLFLDRARAAVPGYARAPGDLAAVARICRRLDGIPLAVELAAAWAGRIDPAGIEAGLAAVLDDPQEPGSSGRSRSRLLDAVVGWGHSLLTEPERVLLRRLSVFPNWCLEQAEQVCAEAPLVEADLLDLLSSLLDRSLIALTGEHLNRVRYRLPAPVREHALARLAEAGELERMRARHAARMVAVTDDLDRVALLGRPMPWAERFAHWDRAVVEYDNLRAALRWAADNGRVRDGLRICAGLRPLWFTGYQFSEGDAWSETFLAMAGETPAAEDGRDGTEALRGRVMVQLAEFAWPRNPFDKTRELVETGEALCRTAGDTESVCLAQNQLALIDDLLGEHESARARLAEVLELARSSGDLWGEAIALNVQGSMAARSGDFAEAETRFNTSLMIMRGIDHRWGVGSGLMAQGAAAEAQGDAQAADRCYREAMDIKRALGAGPELAACLAGVGRVAQQLGSVAQAYDYLGECLQLSHAGGQRAGLAEALASIATVAAREGAREEAARCAGAAAALAEDSGWAGPASDRFPMTAGVADVAVSEETRTWWEEGRRLSTEEAVELAATLSETGRAPRPRPAPSPLSEPPRKALTRREREIAQLIGAGRSNRVISDELSIAPTTVARHVANINRKMGFNSREQIAAWVGRHSVSPEPG